MRSRGNTPKGSTLLELLLVMGILCVVLGLILPALTSGRESSRRISCVNNMRQLSLALQNYQGQHLVYPPGVVNPTGPIHNRPEDMHISWVVQMLPYMEQSMLSESIDPTVPVYDSANTTAALSWISSLLCPSDPSAPVGSRVARRGVGVSSYAANHHDVEAPIDVDQNGMFFRNSSLGPPDLLDGSFCTILLGEKPIEADELGWISGTRATLRNTGTPIVSGSSTNVPADPPTDPDALQVGGYGSFHRSGANFVFGDGSVRFLSRTISPRVYRFLGHRADGELLDEREF